MRRKLTRRQVSAVMREAAKHPLLTSKQLLEEAGVSEVPRTLAVVYFRPLQKV